MDRDQLVASIMLLCPTCDEKRLRGESTEELIRFLYRLEKDRKLKRSLIELELRTDKIADEIRKMVDKHKK
ncbi:MAG: hypothetical protein AB1458_13265 [Bacteroidota bacterium]